MRSDRRAHWSSLTIQLGGIGLFAATVLLAGPAYASGDRSPTVAAAQHADFVRSAEERRAVVRIEQPRGALRFARLDLAVLVLGGGIVTMMAAGAAFLLGPLRLTSPVLFRARTGSEPLLTAEQYTPGHAPA